jgi:O-antigen/teichoic acid export membrane protein
VRQEAKWYIAAQLGFTIIALVIGVPMAVYLGLGAAGILWGQVIILFVLGVIMLRGLFLTGSRVSREATSLPNVKEFALYGLPTMVAVIGVWIMTSADRYVIEYFRNTAEVGLYSMGFAIGNIIAMLVDAFILAAVPILMLTYESDDREITSRLLSQLTRIFILIALPATVGLSVLAGPIIRLLATEPYYPAIIVIPFIALTGFTLGLALLSHIGLLTAKKTPIMTRNWSVAAALNILLNILFIPKFGFVAAAATTLVSHIVLLILNMTSASKYLRWVVMPRSALNSALASIVMGGAIFLVIHISSSAIVNCILGLIAGVIVYFGILVLLKEFSKEGISQMIGLVKDKLPWVRRS